MARFTHLSCLDILNLVIMVKFTHVFKASFERVCKDIARRDFKPLLSVLRIVFYLIDVGGDIFAVYTFLNLEWDSELGMIYARWTVYFMMMPIIATAFAYIVDVIRNEEKSFVTKIRLVILAICFAPVKPFYYLCKAAVATFKRVDPEGRAADDASLVGLLEVMLEAFPQAILQSLAIVYQFNVPNLGYVVPPVSYIQVLLFVKSTICISFTLSTSTYLFKATILSRLTFFFFGFIALATRILCIAFSLYISYALTECACIPFLAPLGILPVIAVWFIKRVCTMKCCTPLSEVHHQCNMRSMFHIIISWTLTAVYNCFTLSGLLMSFITLIPGVYMLVTINSAPLFLAPINSIIYLTLAAVTFTTNLLFVMVPSCRHNIGTHWFNEDEHGRTQLY